MIENILSFKVDEIFKDRILYVGLEIRMIGCNIESWKLIE